MSDEMLGLPQLPPEAGARNGEAGLRSLLAGPCQPIREHGQDVREIPPSAAGSDGREGEVARKPLSASAKYRIELDANRAARDGSTRNDACPWPYFSAEGRHWTACFLLNGGKL